SLRATMTAELTSTVTETNTTFHTTLEAPVEAVTENEPPLSVFRMALRPPPMGVMVGAVPLFSFGATVHVTGATGVVIASNSTSLQPRTRTTGRLSVRLV